VSQTPVFGQAEKRKRLQKRRFSAKWAARLQTEKEKGEKKHGRTFQGQIGGLERAALGEELLRGARKIEGRRNQKRGKKRELKKQTSWRRNNNQNKYGEEKGS